MKSQQECIDLYLTDNHSTYIEHYKKKKEYYSSSPKKSQKR